MYTAYASRDTLPKTTASSLDRPLVYLAEDDTSLRRLLGDGLREAGFEIITAADGRELLRLLSASARGEVPEPDAFVMDVRMPRCSGMDVLGALRLAGWSQPVVMMTGFGDPVLHAKAAEFGAAVVLDKPVDVDDLAAMVDMLLRLRIERTGMTA